MRIPERFKTGENLKKDIGPKLNAIVDFVKSLVLHGDQSTIGVRRTDNGTFIYRLTGGGGGHGGAADEYTGAFAVSQKDDTTVTVKEGSVIAGIEETEVPETDKTISATCVLYLELTYDGGYTAELKTDTAMPDLATDKFTKLIATITVADSKISAIEQDWKAGNIEVNGRFT